MKQYPPQWTKTTSLTLEACPAMPRRTMDTRSPTVYTHDDARRLLGQKEKERKLSTMTPHVVKVTLWVSYSMMCGRYSTLGTFRTAMINVLRYSILTYFCYDCGYLLPAIWVLEDLYKENSMNCLIAYYICSRILCKCILDTVQYIQFVVYFARICGNKSNVVAARKQTNIYTGM